jgi:two-component system sensor histidine kinase PhcS
MKPHDTNRRDYGRPGDNQAFVLQEKKHRYRWAAIGLSLGVLLMPLGSILDWLVYRDHFVPLMAGRLLVTLLLLIGLVTRKTWSAGDWFEPVSFLLILVPGLFISWMMYLTDGSQSHYYFGLILLMILLNLIGFRATEAAAFCVSLIVSYALAVFAGEGLRIADHSEAFQGLFFLFVCGVACVAVCHTYRKNRFEAFCLNRDLAQEEELRRRSIIRLRDTEQQLVHSEKMRAIAGVAAGLLHEINNPVNFSLMAIKVLKRQLPPGTECTETLADIESGVTRIGTIVSDLQSFAHPDQISVQTPFRIRDAVETAIRFLTHELPDGRVLLDESSSLDAIAMGAQSQIVQVLLNVILNAEKAILAKQEDAKPGTRSISMSRDPDGTENRIVVSANPVGDRLAVSVADSGIGMDQEQLRMVKQPFFTTRTGEGLGLGLGICETIVHSHGGRIEIESEPGIGTTVTFDLTLGQPPTSSGHSDGRSSAVSSPSDPVSSGAVSAGRVRLAQPAEGN